MPHKPLGFVSMFIMVSALMLPSDEPSAAQTWRLSGVLSFQSSIGAPQDLIDLFGEQFTALLTYDPNAIPTSIWPPSFANYANHGSLSLTVSLGSASAILSNLQTFIFEGNPGNGSNFNGYGDSVILGGVLSTLALNPKSIDFSFHREPSSPLPGLASFALPGVLSVSDFDNSFIRIEFDPVSGFSEPIRLIGNVAAVSSVPLPASWILLLVALGFSRAIAPIGQKSNQCVELTPPRCALRRSSRTRSADKGTFRGS